MTDKQRLQLVEHLVCGDLGESCEWDLFRNREKMTPREIELAECITRLYTLVHPAGTCGNPHIDWEEDNEKMLVNLLSQGITLPDLNERV